jgi:hypothetical protein
VDRASGGPVLDRQAWHGGKVAVGRHDRAVAQRQGDGGDLDVNLLYGPATPAQIGEQSSKLLRGRSVEWPAREPRKPVAQLQQVAISSHAALDTGEQLPDYGQTRTNPGSALPSIAHAQINPSAMIDEIANDSRVE